MTRFPALVVALAGVALILGGTVETIAATRKKKPAADTSDDATPAPKRNATPPLDLPLPAKTGTDGTKSTPPEKKKEDASEKPSAAKDPDKAATETKAKGEHAPNATVEPADIVEFAAQPPRIQQLIRDAVDLTRLNLTYTFGSADPDSGGMDCSGTIYYLLHAHQFSDVPRDSSGQYLWARRGSGFFPVVSKSADSTEFKELLPGDLMFWTGTYSTGRDIPISHVMMYLGKEKGTGKRIMFGASDGRSYNGIQRWGVSVFDFKMPKADPANPEKAKAEFIGFARIPGLRSPAPPLVTSDQDTTEAGKKDTASSGEKKVGASTPAPDATPKASSSHKKKKKASSD